MDPEKFVTDDSGGTHAFLEGEINKIDSDDYFKRLKKDIPWETRKWSRGHNLPRLVYQYTPHIDECVSVIEELMLKCSKTYGCNVYSAWCNYYRNGNDYTPFHQDSYGKSVFIYSFGGCRSFMTQKISTGEKNKYMLKHGDVLYFDEKFDQHHKHSIPKSTRDTGERISIVIFADPPFSKDDLNRAVISDREYDELSKYFKLEDDEDNCMTHVDEDEDLYWLPLDDRDQPTQNYKIVSTNLDGLMLQNFLSLIFGSTNTNEIGHTNPIRSPHSRFKSIKHEKNSQSSNVNIPRVKLVFHTFKGDLRVGRIIYKNGKTIHPSYPGFTPIVVLTKSSAYGDLGPYVLKDDKDRIMENLWQFRKVYPWVPAVKEVISPMYNNTVIWEHPRETHISNGEPNNLYWKWREKGLNNFYPVRYPVGNTSHRKLCLYLLTDDGQKLDLIEARKQIYLKTYCDLLKEQDRFHKLRDRLKSGENLLIIEVDGPHQESLEYYQKQYGVDESFIENHTMMVTLKNVNIMLNDSTHSFGHGYCLAMALFGWA